MEIFLGLISKENECLTFAVISWRKGFSVFARSRLVCLRVNERIGVALRACVCLFVNSVIESEARSISFVPRFLDSTRLSYTY